MFKRLSAFAAPVVAFALALPAGAISVPDDADIETPTPRSDFDIQSLLDTGVYAARVLLVIVAIIAVIMIIWGGLRYVTAGESEEGTTKGRKNVIYGIVGLAIALLAFAVVQFVESLLEGSLG